MDWFSNVLILISILTVSYLIITIQEPWHGSFLEYFLFFIGGFLIARASINKQRKKKIIILISLGIIIAMFWDPIIAPVVLPGKTVPELIPSIILNGISLVVFLGSYFGFRWLIERKIVKI